MAINKRSSLRAQRSNPENQKLDCHALRARNDEDKRKQHGFAEITTFKSTKQWRKHR